LFDILDEENTEVNSLKVINNTCAALFNVCLSGKIFISKNNFSREPNVHCKESEKPLRNNLQKHYKIQKISRYSEEFTFVVCIPRFES
jgi:hypothetical protein